MGRPSAPGSWGCYVSGDPVHDLASARGHEWLATCVPVRDVNFENFNVDMFCMCFIFLIISFYVVSFYCDF